MPIYDCGDYPQIAADLPEGLHGALKAKLHQLREYKTTICGDTPAAIYSRHIAEGRIQQLEQDIALLSDAIRPAAGEGEGADGWQLVPKEPVTGQKHALLKWRGYDPDAKEETLDWIGQIDVATIGVFLEAYRVMLLAAPKPPQSPSLALAEEVKRIPVLVEKHQMACERAQALSDELDALAEENRVLREALKPFAANAELADDYEDNVMVGLLARTPQEALLVKHLRAARAALTRPQDARPVCSRWKSLSLHGDCRDCGHPKEVHNHPTEEERHE